MIANKALMQNSGPFRQPRYQTSVPGKADPLSSRKPNDAALRNARHAFHSARGIRAGALKDFRTV
jgi:hypothetical protein